MRKRLIGIVLAATLALGCVGVAAAGYTDAFGNTYTDAQVAQLCSHTRLQPAVCP